MYRRRRQARNKYNRMRSLVPALCWYNRIDPKWMRNWKSCCQFFNSSLPLAIARNFHQNVISNDKYHVAVVVVRLELCVSVSFCCTLPHCLYHLSVTQDTSEDERKMIGVFAKSMNKLMRSESIWRRLSANAPFAPRIRCAIDEISWSSTKRKKKTNTEVRDSENEKK